MTRQLLGQRLVRLETDGERTAGIIVEAEAYIGQDDQACHASAGKTPRNAVMFGPPGHAYVYFTYGMHWMLNLVCEPADSPAAVLLRAVFPTEGIGRMRRRRTAWRKSRQVGSRLSDSLIADGPAKLAQAFAVDRRWNGHDLCQPDSQLFVERGEPVEAVTTGPRVGLYSVPEPWKSIPWRFRVPKKQYAELRRREEST